MDPGDCFGSQHRVGISSAVDADLAKGPKSLRTFALGKGPPLTGAGPG